MAKGPSFFSVFATDIASYIQEKQAVGYKYSKGASLLKRFDNYALKSKVTEPALAKDLVTKWTECTGYEAKSTQQARISIMRGLAKYMCRLGREAYVYPTHKDPIERYSYAPYIYTKEEIAAIFAVCDSFEISNKSPYRHLAIPLIIRTL